jgi:hypothetical protein
MGHGTSSFSVDHNSVGGMNKEEWRMKMMQAQAIPRETTKSGGGFSQDPFRLQHHDSSETFCAPLWDKARNKAA